MVRDIANLAVHGANRTSMAARLHSTKPAQQQETPAMSISPVKAGWRTIPVFWPAPPTWPAAAS